MDFSSSASDRGTSVSSVAWTSVGSRLITVQNEALASSIASADLSSDWGGYGIIKVVATFADGNTESVYLEIRFVDPEYRNG